MQFSLPAAGAITLALVPALAQAQSQSMNPDLSVVLDGYYKSNDTALSDREEGLGLGHSELSLSAPVDDLFEGTLTAALESHEGETEVELEEAFLQTTALPFYLSVRGGRFLSQVGYLNERHFHTDAFIERPAAYRAMLGEHYFDDGLRVNLLMPTPFYWQIGAEAFNGSKLADEEGDETIGVYTVNTRFGGDFTREQSWQLGFSWLNNRLQGHGEEEHAGEEHGHEEEHGGHGAEYTGEDLYMADLVWKWAPTGNSREQQLTLSGEYLYADDLGEHAQSEDNHQGWYTSAVYRFAPQWSAGLRYGEVDLKEAHGDHFDDQELKETEAMVAYSHSHFSTIRLQYTHQSAHGFEDEDNAIALQYVMSFGAHGAHDY